MTSLAGAEFLKIKEETEMENGNQIPEGLGNPPTGSLRLQRTQCQRRASCFMQNDPKALEGGGGGLAER